MKVCFDVNALIYLYTNAPQQLEVLAAYDVATLRGYDACIPACALADINYILHRCGLRGEKLGWAMDALFEMFRVFDVNEQDGRAAFRAGGQDECAGLAGDGEGDPAGQPGGEQDDPAAQAAVGEGDPAAQTGSMKDFEDALIAYSAARNGIDVILTYNVKDFANSPVKALLPSDFTALFKPENVTYAEAEL